MTLAGTAPLVVKVLPDVPAIDRAFEYIVPDRLRDQIRVGTMVRVELHGRRVGGWVVEVGVTATRGRALKPIAKITGWGPDAMVIDLARWAAWRWSGRTASLLGTASPPGAVVGLPAPSPTRTPVPAALEPLAEQALDSMRSLVRLPPAGDPLPFALAAAGRGDALVLAPSVDAGRSIAVRLRRAGVDVALAPRDWARAAAGGVSVVGARAAAWAPVPRLGAVVVVDEHDESYQEERAPTWHARDVAIERARRAGVPCVLLSPCPSLEAQAWAAPRTVSTAEERAGWPIFDVVDRRHDDPRAGLFAERLVPLLRDRSRGRVLCVLNRTGRARLLACRACGELARCERCDAAVEQLADGTLRCPRCGTVRPLLCLACGGTAFRNLRRGVTRVREELEALVGEQVAELTAAGGGERPDALPRIVVGTEAVLHQVPAPIGAIVFLDFDQELLAPRYRAAEQALALLARAARLLGGRAGGGRLAVQTRLPKHTVLDAALHADPSRFSKVERALRDATSFPPASAMALVSGASAGAYIGALEATNPLGIEILAAAQDRWLVRAADHQTLCDALAAVQRPAGRLRIEVDPLRV